MDVTQAAEQLRRLREELRGLPADYSSSEFTSWDHRVRSVLERSLGDNHHITNRFKDLTWISFSMNRSEDQHRFRASAKTADGLLDAAILELETLSSPTDQSEGATYDPELWEHVQALVAAEEWGKVASQAAIFTEDRIRKWAGRRPDEVGERLMTAVFGDDGGYRLGITSGEKQGWHRFAMGVAKALRNADTHRIQHRRDGKRYAMGVLGANSLLLTQMRYEHGNRFQDTSPASGDSPEG